MGRGKRLRGRSMPKALLTASFSGIPRVVRFARLLRDLGFDVTIIEWDRDGKLNKFEVIEGIKYFRYVKKSKFGFQSLPNLLGWIIFQVKHLLTHNYDMVQPENLDSLIPTLIGILFKERRPKIVYDLADFYGDAYIRAPILSNLISYLERSLIKRIDGVILVSPAQLLQIRQIPKRVAFVYNVPDEPVPEDLTDGYDVFFAGTLGRDRCPELVKLIVASAISKVTVGIAGFGECEDIISNLSKKVANVEFLGRISRKEVIKLTKSSRAVFSVFNPRRSRNNIYAIANKFLDAVALERPVIVSKGTYLALLVRKFNIGFIIDPDKLECYVKKLKNIRKTSFSREGFIKLKRIMSWEFSIKSYKRLLESIGLYFQ